MTPKQFQELLEYVEANNSWGLDMYHINWERNRKAVKYVDCCFDSRDGRIWRVEFRSVTGEEDTAFRVENDGDIQKVYAWLDEPLRK